MSPLHAVVLLQAGAPDAPAPSILQSPLILMAALFAIFYFLLISIIITKLIRSIIFQPESKGNNRFQEFSFASIKVSNITWITRLLGL